MGLGCSGSPGRDRDDPATVTEISLANPKLVTYHSSSVKGAAGARPFMDETAGVPGGRLAQLVRALP